MNDARVDALLTNAAGDSSRVPLEWSVDEDGVYVAEVRLEAPGDWSATVEAVRDSVSLGRASVHFRVGPSDVEFFDAGRRTQTLRRLAEETGGRFYPASGADRLPEDLSVTGAGVTLTEERDLWDMPILFLLILGLIGAEWGYRRMRALV